MENKKINKNNKVIYLISGIFIVLILIISYFIKINVDSGGNYIINERALGILIFHNPFILSLYVLIAVVLIVKGLRKDL